MIWVVYNPTVHVEETVSLVLPHSNIIISKWMSSERKFQQQYAEA